LTFLKEPADATIASSPEVLKGYRDKGAPVLDVVSVDKNKGVAHFRINPDFTRKYKDQCLKQALEVVRKRLRNMGVADGVVTRKGVRLIVEVRGADPEPLRRLKSKIGSTAMLEFKPIDDRTPYMAKVTRFLHALGDAKAHAKMKREDLLQYFNPDPKSGKLGWKRGLERTAEIKVKTEAGSNGPGGRPRRVLRLEHKSRLVLERFFEELPERLRPPANREIGYGQEPVRDIRGRPTKGTIWRTYYLHRIAPVTGKNLDHAAVGRDQFARPEVHFRFGREGEKKFRALTRANIGRRLAIIVDRTVRSAPVIQSEIGAKGRISLGGGLKPPSTMLMEAKDLAALLRAGALPAPLTLARETRIGRRAGREVAKPR
jgi:protein-export membrane protein SecD